MRGLVGIIALSLLLGVEVTAQQTAGGRWSGVVYSDYYYNVARDTGFSSLSNTAVSGAKDLHGFRFRRIYLTYDSDISQVFSMRFRFEADEAANASNGRISTFVKDAYLRWKDIFAGQDLMLGIQPTPAFEVSESVWGYRSLEKTILDLRGIVSSRDQGASLNGALFGDGKVRYKVMYGNGSANAPEADKYKRFYAHVAARPIDNVTVTVYGDLNARAKLNTAGGRVGNDIMTYAGFVGYQRKGEFSVGLEAFVQATDHGFSSAGRLTTRTSQGVSFFGNLSVRPDMSLVGRVDAFDPNTHTASSGDARTFGLFGLDWRPDARVSIIPNILVEQFQSASGRSVDPSLTVRATFVYQF